MLLKFTLSSLQFLLFASIIGAQTGVQSNTYTNTTSTVWVTATSSFDSDDTTITSTVTETATEPFTQSTPTASFDTTVTVTVTASERQSSAHVSYTTVTQTEGSMCTATVHPSDSCQHGQYRCNGDDFDQCVYGKWVTRQCASGTKCRPSKKIYILCD
ncbi:hypothetical protein K493DRAFT_298601 [Basidiobolus meristosporus CBS 931.73]|uniref:Carbohydrate-binding module family 19 domain-containing protein n=1 Tax=Basidiobolus meristosporus CBS 931.73 TaxID=1314790 RepID=A0A1Y1YTX3_9FUNG|nr:hypothetical protein K493DRAFT_298601 [Basidiobolus meristosporus CBS 931.73]|eukprot:ORY01025.1 hypothetical protein K493DRAFT_298601 [Basidiobolus meristosporus CBS 931.73]